MGDLHLTLPFTKALSNNFIYPDSSITVTSAVDDGTDVTVTIHIPIIASGSVPVKIYALATLNPSVGPDALFKNAANPRALATFDSDLSGAQDITVTIPSIKFSEGITYNILALVQYDWPANVRERIDNTI